jgi:hypothetical protein
MQRHRRSLAQALRFAPRLFLLVSALCVPVLAAAGGWGEPQAITQSRTIEGFSKKSNGVGFVLMVSLQRSN